MSALVTLFIANLPTLIKAGGAVVKYVHDFRAAAQQADVWTDDHEIEFQATLQNAGMSSEWQPDPKA